MKKFTCKEVMGGNGGCDEVFEGETAMDVAAKVGAHVASSTDEIHKKLREQMKEQIEKGSEEDKKKWMNWFQGEWDKKTEA
jgi:hypothetical protein